MKVVVCNNDTEMAKLAADVIDKIVRDEPECTLGLATGSSPVNMYNELSRRCKEEGLDFSKIHTVNLDEYIGLDGTHDQSYRYFMNDNLFDHINIDKANTYVAKGIGDVKANLKEFNDILDKTDIRIQVLGVGPDGHLGFNEPGAVLYDGAHEETLEESTIDANMKYFSKREEVPTTAVTMGMGNIMRAQELLLLISGKKEEAAKKLLMEDKIDPQWPVTFMRLHRNAIVFIEKNIAEKIGYKN